jgi:hypothetical protein
VALRIQVTIKRETFELRKQQHIKLLYAVRKKSIPTKSAQY